MKEMGKGREGKESVKKWGLKERENERIETGGKRREEVRRKMIMKERRSENTGIK